MANAIVRNIPNTLTSCNLFSGCIAAYMAFHGNYKEALLFIVLGAMFDFFDGMTARLLHVSSPIGKELDSLADDITFGLTRQPLLFPCSRKYIIRIFNAGSRHYAIHGFSDCCILGIKTSQI